MYPGQNRLAILFLFTVLVRHLSMSVLEKSLVRIFRVCCLLFSYQCSFLLLPFHATAFILYQSVSCLSTTFLNYFLLLFWISQAAALIYYHISLCLSTTFFVLFCLIFLCLFLYFYINIQFISWFVCLFVISIQYIV